MGKHHRVTLIIAFLMLVVLLISNSYALPAEKKIHALYLNSYQEGYKWSDDILTGLESVLPLENPDFTLQVEYMDTQSTADPAYMERLLELYRVKFQGSHFDLILSSDDAAYTFLLNHGQEFFPQTPVVFCGVNSFDPETLKGHPNFTGVVEGYDIRSTLETASKLNPAIKTVYYINDTTVTGQAIMKEFQKTMDQLAGTFVFKPLVGSNLSQLEKKVQTLPQDSILLMLIYFRDAEEKNYGYSESVARLASKSSVPIYGVWDFHLGAGIVGGRLTSGFYQGETAGRIALRVLEGEPPESIPVITEETTRYAFDYQQLKKFHIPTDQLPPESDVINYTSTFKKQILVLNSYHKGMEWEDDIDTGLKSRLKDRLKDMDLTYEFLDMKQNSDPVFIQRTYQLLKLKYTGKRFDAILAVDDDAFRFLTAYHDGVFPGTPVVFSGVNYYDDAMASGKPWFTGVVEDYDLKGTLDAALELQPGTNHVVVINDTTLTGKANHRNIERIQSQFADRVTFEFWEDMDMSDIQTRVKTLPGDTIILLMSFNRDKSSNSYSYDDSIRLISAEASVPIYGVWDFYLGKGLLGGMLTSGFSQGETAGAMIDRILDGTAPADIPVIQDSPNQYMFDQKVLYRYKLPMDNLPAGSQIINAPQTLRNFYEANQGLVLAVTFIIMSLTVLVLTLMVLLLNNTLRIRKGFEDQLERARLEADLANQAKGRFLANMSHEIRTPMNGLIGMTDQMLQTDLNAAQQKYMEAVRSSAHALLRVINDILDYSKIEAGKLEISYAPLEVPSLVEEVASLFRDGAHQKGLTLETDIDPTIPQWLQGDSVRLRQVLSNLMGNAVKFTENGTITLRAQIETPDPAQPILRFTVEDTGIGIEKDVQDLIFQDYTQFDSKTIRSGIGTGLGLSISRQLVGLMQGTLQLESKPGTGSRFYFDIPMALAHGMSSTAIPSEEPEAPDSTLHAKLLVAEDDGISQTLMRLILEKRGHRVTVVSNGHEALSALTREDYDLVMMDVSMPELNGIETTAIIRSQEPQGVRIPIIAMTAYALKGDREKMLAAGMDDYVTKPIQVHEVYEKLDQWLKAPPQ